MIHADAVSMVRGKSGRSRRKVGNNTWAEIMPDGSVDIILHNTRIVSINADGTYRLNSGGWHTHTTKDRMNRFSPARIYQHKFEWFVGSVGDGKIRFFDGIVI